MKHCLKISAAIIAFVLLIAAVQTAELRFASFKNYLNTGYGNKPYFPSNK